MGKAVFNLEIYAKGEPTSRPCFIIINSVQNMYFQSWLWWQAKWAQMHPSFVSTTICEQ
jgi:hypothetical protein